MDKISTYKIKLKAKNRLKELGNINSLGNPLIKKLILDKNEPLVKSFIDRCRK